jgi:hypothetical protein
MGFTQAAALAEGGVVEIIGLDADRGGDVVADKFEPGALLGSENDILGDVSFDPLDEALIDRLGKRQAGRPNGTPLTYFSDCSSTPVSECPTGLASIVPIALPSTNSV